MIPLRALVSQWFVIPLNPPGFSPLNLQLGFLPSLASLGSISLAPPWSSKPVTLPWSTIHWLHSSGTSSVFQSTGSTMVSFTANSSMDLHHYGSTIRSSPPPAPPWSLHLLPPPLGVSSTTVVFSSAVVFSSVGSARVCFAPPFILCSWVAGFFYFGFHLIQLLCNYIHALTLFLPAQHLETGPSKCCAFSSTLCFITECRMMWSCLLI